MCNEALETADINEAGNIFQYEVETKNMVASLIGYKTRAMIENAKKAFAKTGDKKYKKQLGIALLKHKEHTELFDDLFNYIMESAKHFNYDRNAYPPEKAIEDWENIFAKRLRPGINPQTIQQGARTMRATKNLVKRIIKKREKILKKGKVPKHELFFAPPEFVASHSDRFGFALNIINKALRLSDKDIQVTSKFMSRIDSLRETITDNLYNAINDPKVARLFNLNTASMWGVQGIGGLPFRLRGTDEDILLIGDNIIDGIRI